MQLIVLSELSGNRSHAGPMFTFHFLRLPNPLAIFLFLGGRQPLLSVVQQPMFPGNLRFDVRAPSLMADCRCLVSLGIPVSSGLSGGALRSDRGALRLGCSFAFRSRPSRFATLFSLESRDLLMMSLNVLMAELYAHFEDLDCYDFCYGLMSFAKVKNPPGS